MYSMILIFYCFFPVFLCADNLTLIFVLIYADLCFLSTWMMSSFFHCCHVICRVFVGSVVFFLSQAKRFLANVLYFEWNFKWQPICRCLARTQIGTNRKMEHEMQTKCGFWVWQISRIARKLSYAKLNIWCFDKIWVGDKISIR